MGATDLRVASLSPGISQLNAEYARAIDDDRLEEWPDFFTDACVYTITSVDNHRRGMPIGLMYAESKAMLRDRVTALRQANIYERQAYRHLVGLPAILGEDELAANEIFDPQTGQQVFQTPLGFQLIEQFFKRGLSRSIIYNILGNYDVHDNGSCKSQPAPCAKTRSVRRAAPSTRRIRFSGRRSCARKSVSAAISIASM